VGHLFAGGSRVILATCEAKGDSIGRSRIVRYRVFGGDALRVWRYHDEA
jgi:hypothetical protein